MGITVKVFASGRSQAIRLPKEFRVSGKEVRLSRVPGGILISEGDPWDAFEEGCRILGEEFFEVVDGRDRRTSLRNRHPARVGSLIQPITAEDDILGEMLDDTRDSITKSSAVLKS